MQGGMQTPRESLLTGYYSAIPDAWYDRATVQGAGQGRLPGVQGGAQALRGPTHRLLHHYSAVLHDHAAMQGARSHWGWGGFCRCARRHTPPGVAGPYSLLILEALLLLLCLETPPHGGQTLGGSIVVAEADGELLVEFLHQVLH